MTARPAGRSRTNDRKAGRGLDIPLGTGGPDRFLAWLLAPMTYLAILAVAVALLVGDLLTHWDNAAAGVISVQVPPIGDRIATTARVGQIMDIIEEVDGVASVRALPPDETAELLEPWLGDAAILAELSLPVMLDVRADGPEAVDIAALTATMHEIDVEITVDDHGVWLDQILGAAETVGAIALASLGLVALAILASIVLAARAGFAIHRQTINILHLMGATDRYIARQFQRRMLSLTLRGALAGLVIAAITLIAVHYLVGPVRVPLTHAPTLGPLDWVLLCLVVPITVGVGWAVSRLTILASLSRLA